VFADLSKNLMDVATEQALLEMARQSGLEQHRDAMFAGDKINTTEDRSGDALVIKKSASSAYATCQRMKLLVM
jgi:glucose-6-phosphate isomerase